jgi:hypothetical protein
MALILPALIVGGISQTVASAGAVFFVSTAGRKKLMHL